MQTYKGGLALSKLSDALKKIPLLQTFEGNPLKEMLNASRMLAYKPNEVIIPEGAFGNHLYVLVSGQVRIVKDQNLIAVLDQLGEVFGELSALSDEPRTASVIATEPTWCLELNPGCLENLPPEDRVAGYALLYSFIAQVLADRLKKTTNELTLAVKELEDTRCKLTELRQNPTQQALDNELELATEQLWRTREKLARLGSPAEPAPTT